MRTAIKCLTVLYTFSVLSYLFTILKITRTSVQFDLIEIQRGTIGTTEFKSSLPTVTNATRILILAYARSGSTFTGDLIQQTPSSFFTFEPIAVTTDGVMRINETKFEQAFEVLDDLFECRLRRFELFHEQYKSYSRFKMSNFFQESCSENPATCATPGSVKMYCDSSQVKISKVVRLPMRAVYKFMVDHPETRKNWKVLHLRRDPRGMYNSRSNRNWCDSTTCLNVTGMCDEIREDLHFFDKIKNDFNAGSNLIPVYYEKLVNDPMNESKSVYKQLGIAHSERAKLFIQSHTKSIDLLLKKHPYSTVRNSKETAIAWRTKVKPSVIKLIEDECSDVISKLGYEKVYK